MFQKLRWKSNKGKHPMSTSGFCRHSNATPNTMNILMIIQFSQQEFQNQMDYQKHRNLFNLPMRLRHQTSKGLTNFKMHTANARLYKNLFDLKLNMPDPQNKWISGLLNRHACLERHTLGTGSQVGSAVPYPGSIPGQQEANIKGHEQLLFAEAFYL